MHPYRSPPPSPKPPRYLALIVLLGLVSCVTGAGIAPHVVGAGTLPERFSMSAGTNGTVTVGTGKYATLCTAAGTATNMTAVVTPCGASVPSASCTTAYTVTIPTSYPVAIPFPPGPQYVADSSTIVFANTAEYFCNIQQYSP